MPPCIAISFILQMLRVRSTPLEGLTISHRPRADIDIVCATENSKHYVLIKGGVETKA